MSKALSDYETMRALFDRAGIKYGTQVGGWKGGDAVIELMGIVGFHFWDGKLSKTLLPHNPPVA